MQESPPELKNNISREENPKQDAKAPAAKATDEGAQGNDKSDLEKANVANQSSNVPSATIEANGIDNEDSINLTIGEDEENLLAEEVRRPTAEKYTLC